MLCRRIITRISVIRRVERDAMATEESELTLTQAESLALSGLAEHWPDDALGLAEGKTLISECGWVFTVDIAGRGAVSERNGRLFPTLVLVVKTSGQVVASSRPYSPQEFAQVCERLLARSHANARAWCLTMSVHLGGDLRDGRRHSIAEDAQRAGLEQIRAGRTLTGSA